MSWNNGGGPSPWGNPGGNNNKPGSGGPGGGPERGPWGTGGPGRNQGAGLPDLDDLIARLQDKARRFVPGGNGTGGGRGNRRMLGLIAIVALAVWAASGVYRVQPDEQGIVLRFGAYNGRTTLPGLNYHIPWPVEQVMTPAVTRINRVEVGFRGGTAERGGLSRGRDGDMREVRARP